MSPVGRLLEARRLVRPQVQVEDQLVLEAKLLAAWLEARRLSVKRPSPAADAAAEQAFAAYRAHLLQRLPRPR